MASEFDGYVKLAYAIFERAWYDAKGISQIKGDMVDKRSMQPARNFLMGRFQDDRDGQDYWNQYIQDDHFIEQTRLKARKMFAFAPEIKSSHGKEQTTREEFLSKNSIPSNLPPIETSVSNYCRRNQLNYHRVKYISKKYKITVEQSAYYVKKEGK